MSSRAHNLVSTILEDDEEICAKDFQSSTRRAGKWFCNLRLPKTCYYISQDSQNSQGLYPCISVHASPVGYWYVGGTDLWLDQSELDTLREVTPPDLSPAAKEEFNRHLAPWQA